MRRPERLLLSALGAAWLLCACERSPSSEAPDKTAPTTSPTTQPAARPTPADPALRLRDYVAEPDIRDEEAPASALRILSTGPNITEICCALGLRDRLVGRTRYCDYPPGIEALPSIGALTDASAERVAGLRPDVVLVPGESRELVHRLRPLGVRIESLADTSLNDLYASISQLGEIAGRPRTAAALIEALRGQHERVTRRYAEGRRVRYLLVTGTLAEPPTPPFVAGPGSFYDALLSGVGHQNVLPPDHRAFGSVSLEFVVRADPDVIIELDPDGRMRPQGSADALRAWGRVGSLRAVHEGRVVVLRGPEHYLIGPRVMYTYAALCEALRE
ncbi:MAG: ABC transporter substrate-binding protein [Phycisphaerales bacterium]|nr:ABC transporter substrate-binding protein [Phycisphaerales bacterium]